MYPAECCFTLANQEMHIYHLFKFSLQDSYRPTRVSLCCSRLCSTRILLEDPCASQSVVCTSPTRSPLTRSSTVWLLPHNRL